MNRVLHRRAFQLVFFLGILISTWTAHAQNEYAIITHPQTIEKTLSVNMLRAIFGMSTQTWPDGTKIHVFVLSDDSLLHQKFVKGTLNIFPYQLRSAWDRLIFSGTGQAPIKVDSIDEMLARVANTPGAIGYIWKTKIDKRRVDVLQVK